MSVSHLLLYYIIDYLLLLSLLLLELVLFDSSIVVVVHVSRVNPPFATPTLADAPVVLHDVTVVVLLPSGLSVTQVLVDPPFPKKLPPTVVQVVVSCFTVLLLSSAQVIPPHTKTVVNNNINFFIFFVGCSIPSPRRFLK